MRVDMVTHEDHIKRDGLNGWADRLVMELAEGRGTTGDVRYM